MVNDREIALFNIDGTVCLPSTIFVLMKAVRLCEGRAQRLCRACPWHDLAFDVRNGQGTDGGGYCVGSYEVQVEGADILVGPRRKA